MSTTRETGRVIWAVDPIAEDKKLQFRTAQVLTKFTKGTGYQIEPVCVLSSDRLKIPLAAFKTNEKKYHLEAEEVLTGWMKELKIPNLMQPRLLAHGIHANTNVISTLLEYARKSGALLIAIGTHTRKKWERFLWGSFAESMILKSDVPIFVVNPKNRISTKFSRILFPTDFCDASRMAFHTLLPTAKSLKARIILYYKFEYIVPATVYGGIAFTSTYDQYLHTDLEVKRGLATKWIEEAKQMGVKIEVILDEKPGYVPEGIMKALKKSKSDLIAMASNSGSIASTLIGSIARQVVRIAPVPVWVIHPSKEILGAENNVPNESRAAVSAGIR